MSLGRHSFKLNDAARLVRALKAAGLSILRVELDDGKVIAVTDSEAAAGADRCPDQKSLRNWKRTQRAMP
jgi:hypothetical protein